MGDNSFYIVILNEAGFFHYVDMIFLLLLNTVSAKEAIKLSSSSSSVFLFSIHAKVYR